MVYSLPPALRYVRECRTEALMADPQRAWELAEGDPEVFVHAMVEAGHIFPKGTNAPYPECPVCGWKL